MRTPVMAGLIPGMESYTLWMPPLYILLQSFFFYILEPGVHSSRILASIIGSFNILLGYFILKRLDIPKAKIYWFLTVLSTDFLFIRVTHTARMEGLCLFFALASVFILLKKQSFVSRLEFFSSGILLSLSFLSHPFGVVYSFLILYILYTRKLISIFNLLLIGIGGLIPLSFWGLYIIPHWDLFLIQFGSQLSRKKELFSVFSQIAKFKIIVSSYTFPIVKAILLGFFIIVLTMNWKNLKESAFRFFIYWLGLILVFVYISTESWYVFHLSVPFSFIIGYWFFQESKPLKYTAYAHFGFNLIVLGWVLLSNFFIWNTPSVTEEYFHQIAEKVSPKKNVYIQSIPDPYYYLLKKFPDKKLLEFIPGELPVKSNNFQETIQAQEAFIFYDESLINPIIKKYLSENQTSFAREEISLGTGYKIQSIIYIKK